MMEVRTTAGDTGAGGVPSRGRHKDRVAHVDAVSCHVVWNGMCDVVCTSVSCLRQEDSAR